MGSRGVVPRVKHPDRKALYWPCIFQRQITPVSKDCMSGALSAIRKLNQIHPGGWGQSVIYTTKSGLRRLAKAPKYVPVSPSSTLAVAQLQSLGRNTTHKLRSFFWLWTAGQTEYKMKRKKIQPKSEHYTPLLPGEVTWGCSKHMGLNRIHSKHWHVEGHLLYTTKSLSLCWLRHKKG